MLRRTSTEAETTLWRRLRAHQLGVHFRRQYSVLGYVADFACVSAKLIIEADGGQHADGADLARDQALSNHGWRVLRFWNNEVHENLEGVLEAIVRVLGEAPSQPSPASRERARGGAAA